MIPRIGKQGSSFKGAAAYYLHDKQADTSHRVGFTETRNVPTDNPELAWRLMAATAMDADRLKEESGAPRVGRKSTKPVWTLSLSWHPEQHPESADMVSAMDAALKAVGLQDRQALYVEHTDEPHKHIHAIVNLVDPETGRSATLSRSKERLSAWALEYERTHGQKIYCEQRAENEARRRQAKQSRQRGQRERFPRYQEPALDLKAEIAKRYQSADSGRAFAAAMKEMGYEVAQGRRVVLVGPDGRIHSLSRQLDGVTAAQLRAKLADFDLPGVDDTRKLVDLSQTSAGIEAAERRRRYEGRETRIYNIVNRSRSRLQDRLHRVDEQLERDYGEGERALRAQLQALESARGIFGRRQRQQEIEAARRSLADIERRKDERRGTLARILEQRTQLAAAIAAKINDRAQARPIEAPSPAPAAAPTAQPEDGRAAARREYDRELSRYYRQAAAGREPQRDHGPTHDHDR